MWPFVRDELILESILLGEMRDKGLYGCQDSLVVLDLPATLTIKVGDKKFSINQNLTVLWVCFMTLRIMIEANR